MPDHDPQAFPSRKTSHRGRILLFAGVVAVAAALFAASRFERQMESLQNENMSQAFDREGAPNAPFVKTPDAVTAKMIEVAELNADDVVYDLGCGDGRLVITAALQAGCKGIGFDIDPERVAEARHNVELHGVGDLVEIREQDVFTVDMKEADVILMYLLPWMTKRLIPRFQEMKPGSRIISHDFGLGDIKDVEPESTLKVLVEDEQTAHLVHKWTVPLKVAAEQE